MAHLFPYRTQKLSISAAIVAMRDIVRVARCQVFFYIFLQKNKKMFDNTYFIVYYIRGY